ncbi:SRPBCC family protein [Polaribacter sp. Z022]|uniref:SRPBCC family protein n=1 Tax=Polaribacter sp. Z022 TaxID=2927125 RepID=UPI00201FCF8D|nr:SRPBCC family protein [Polaribacter sp. Z022]MCL7753932.1 SRPBCC family protein [Polaribacter sp. Z022]
MKFLKYLLGLVVVLIVGVLIFGAMQPSEYDVSRSKVIKAPISAVYNTVNDLKTWEKWGPWHDEDSTIVVSYGEKTVGVGASDSWTSKDGPGSMKTVNVIPNKLIEQKMQFGDADPSDIIWHFEEKDGGTNITWQMKETKAPFMFKLISGFMGGWENFFGPMEEKGLNNLEKVVLEAQKLANSFRITPVVVKDLPAQKFIGYYHKTTTDMSNMTELFQTDMPKAGMYAMKNGLEYGDFTPAAVYNVWDMENNIAEFYIGLILKKDLKPGEGMSLVNLPKGATATASKFGNYGTGEMEIHNSLLKYATDNKKEIEYPIWEAYVNDPTMVKPQDIQTDYFYSLK